MIRVEILNNRIYIDSEMREKELCKSIPGARFDRDERKWHVPLTWAACRQLRGTFQLRLEIGPNLIYWAQKELAYRIKPAMLLREALDLAAQRPEFDGLYSFQKAGAEFLLTAKNALLGDPMGAGKTIQVIAAAKIANALPMLVVCPASMRRTWAREVAKWWPDAPVYVVEGTATKRQKTLAAAAENPGVVVINWESVRLHSRLAPYGSVTLTDAEKTPKELNQIPFKIVVADEAHRMKDPKSKQCRALWATAHSPTVVYRWALTGTPLTKAPDTLYPVLHFLDPLSWPGKTAFIDRYTMSAFNHWGGLEVFGIKPDMEPEFFAIFDPMFRRMPKNIILPQLPPITYERRYVEMGTKQAKAYNSMAESLYAETDDGSMVIARNPISQLTRLTQFASSYTEDTPDGLRLSDPSCKLDQLMDDLEDYLSDDEGVVVFAQSRQLIRLASQRLEKANIDHSVIEGGQSPDQRQNSIDAFQEGKVNVILVVIAAGGVGITLTRGRIGIFLQRSWSNVDQQQAIGRIHRIGSERHNSIVVIDYVTGGTVEEGQLEVLDGKEDMLQEIVRDRAAIQRLLKGI